jgi:hypothetical protein
MLEWLGIINIKPSCTAVPGQVFRMKPIVDTSQDELIILFANMIGGN